MTTGSKLSIRLDKGEHQVARLDHGETLRITDVAGGQCCQVVPVNRGDRRERFSAPNTMLMNKQVYFAAGAVLYSYYCNPMLTISTTTTTHDALPGKLPDTEDPLGRNELGAVFEMVGMASHQVPYPFLAFVHHSLAEDGSVDYARSRSVAGDTVHLRAELDLDVVVANTPQLLAGAERAGAIALDVLPPGVTG